jgi:fermentation-respiration switch protein FrsA (DUF1100 family)
MPSIALRLAVRAARIALAVVLLAGVMLIVFGRFLADRLLYHPDPDLWTTPAAAHLPFSDVALVTDDGVHLHGWHVRAPAGRALVVVCHGNAGNVADRVPMAELFARAGLDTLLFDYRGFGRSGGRPSEQGLYRDGEAARRWAEQQGLPVVLYGESLGGAVAVELAVRRPPALLVLQSTFTSLPEMAARLVPLGHLLARQRFASLEKIARLRAPLLVIHGDRDELVPYRMGQRLLAAAPGPKELLTVAGGHHNDLFARAGADIARRTAALAVAR